MLPVDFSTTPALPIPDYKPNFDHPENIFPLISATVGPCLGVSTLCIILRIWARFFIMKSHGWDDYMMILSWLCFIPYTVLGLECRRVGSGVHLYDVRLSDFFVFLKYVNVLEVFYNPLIFITKLSILLQYQRIFCPIKTPGDWMRRAISGLIAFNLLFYTAVMIPQIMACNPREKIWHPYLSGRCLDLPLILISGAVVNILSDFSILILPLVKVWRLQLNPSKKFGVAAVFAFGIFACVSSVFRLQNNIRFRYTQDVTWDLTPVALWTYGEIASGIVCGCLPTVPLVFKSVAPKIRTAISSRSKKSTNTSENLGEATQGGGIKKSVYIELGETNVSESQEAIHSSYWAQDLGLGDTAKATI